MNTQEELERTFLAQGRTVIEKLEAWSQCQGDKACLYYGEDDSLLSYLEFDQLCNRLANGLRDMGVGKGDRVSLLSNNALVSCLTMFAAWKLGALYCPINNRYKGELLAYIINDIQPEVLLLDQYFVCSVHNILDDLLALPACIVFEPNADQHDYSEAVMGADEAGFQWHNWNDLLTYSTEKPDAVVEESDPASIIYTSGTTGNPKGVVQNHKWLHAYIYIGIQCQHPDSVIYNDLPLYHVGGAYFNVVRAIWTGCRIALWDRFSPKEFWDRVRKSAATEAVLLDVMINWLMQAPPSATDRDNGLSMVVMLPLPANHHEVAHRFGFDFVGVGYGSSELGSGFTGLIDELGDVQGAAAGSQTAYSKAEVRRMYAEVVAANCINAGEGELKKGYIGVPSPLVEVEVVDDSGHPVAAGTPGHVRFRPRIPDIFFREYFNQPDETAAVMKNGSFSPADIISYDETGVYYFEDRQQGFIRVRGENFSANTVEARLDAHPVIDRSAVIAIPGETDIEEDVVAFITLLPHAGLTEAELRSWVETELPRFMWPKHIRIVEQLPVTPTFKIQKHKLKTSILNELADV